MRQAGAGSAATRRPSGRVRYFSAAELWDLYEDWKRKRMFEAMEVEEVAAAAVAGS